MARFCKSGRGLQRARASVQSATVARWMYRLSAAFQSFRRTARPRCCGVAEGGSFTEDTGHGTRRNMAKSVSLDVHCYRTPSATSKERKRVRGHGLNFSRTANTRPAIRTPKRTSRSWDKGFAGADLDRPGQAFRGVAEALRGLAGAAIANAPADAIGAPSHDTVDRGGVLAAINPVVCDP